MKKRKQIFRKGQRVWVAAAHRYGIISRTRQKDKVAWVKFPATASYTHPFGWESLEKEEFPLTAE